MVFLLREKRAGVECATMIDIDAPDITDRRVKPEKS
jgi:hypothetical protein